MKLDRLLAIIGNAGSGKSYILQHAFLGAAQDSMQSPDKPMPFLLDLARHLSGHCSFRETLDYRYERLFSRTLEEHQPGCILFLDALDERLLTENNHYDFVNNLFLFLHHHQEHLVSVVLACRRAFWNPDWLSGLTGWEVYHADYLDIDDYSTILPDPSVRQRLFDRAISLGIEDLLRLPFIGFDLARKYAQGQEMPTSRQSWFRERIATVLRGSQRDQERGQAPPLESLLELSREMACLATFGEAQMWTAQEAVNQLGASHVLREEIGPITYDQVHTLLQRPLFTRIDDCFAFSHQLFREYLAAEALSPLPLLKQRQLLESPLINLQHRILSPHRGVAVFLAELCPEFCEYLIENEPLVAFVAELSSLSPEADERLTKAVIDESVDKHRDYRWPVRPRGERPFEFLAKHRPRDIAGFAYPYLESPDEVALLWGTACLAVWGESANANDRLIDLAHRNELSVEIRTNAISAILASGEREAVRQLYDLLDNREDQVRGHALYAYRRIESPTPSEYIGKLQGGARDHRLHCLLQDDVDSFGGLLGETQLGEALQEALEHFDSIGNLRPYLLSGLFRRALELGFDDVPPRLVARSWLGSGFSDLYYGRTLQQLVSGSPCLFARVWNHIMKVLEHGDQRYFYGTLDGPLAEVCDDHIFDLLPTDRSALTWGQEMLIHDVLRMYFAKEPTAERLQVFQARAPAFTSYLQLPSAGPTEPSYNPADSEDEINHVLSTDESSTTKASRVMGIIAQALHGDNRSQVTPEEAIRFLRDFSEETCTNVLGVFAACVLQTQYSRIQPGEQGQPRTPLQLAVPFWVLWNLGCTGFPTEKLDEFIRCYAFSPRYSDTDHEMYSSLLDELSDRDSECWAETVKWLIDFPGTTSGGPLEYLIPKGTDLYIERCRQRLSECDFNIGDFSPLLSYWVVQEPSDLRAVLHRCHQCVEREDQKTALLYALLTKDDDWAWSELHDRIQTDNPPLGTEHLSRHRPLRLPDNPSRLHILADWYVCARRNRPDDGWPGDLGRYLLETIVRIGGEAAIDQFRRLQTTNAFPGAEWLGHDILRIEDEMLSYPGEVTTSGDLLNFVNREAFGVVLCERDLFEWVCQAIEDVKERLEGPGDQILGYWNRHNNDWEPKTEPECQNVFWPAIRDRLSNLGIVGVEERPIQAGRADLWVEKPVQEGQSLQAIVELKTARRGYGPEQLVEPLQTQLWQQYLEPSGCKHGIYVVLWFKNEQRYPYPSRWETPQQLLEDLDHRKDETVMQHQVDIICYVIDMTTAARLH